MNQLIECVPNFSEGRKQEIINEISKTSAVDILINNAGVLLTGNLFVTNTSTISEKDLKETFQVNFFSVVSLTQKLLPLIKKSDAGRIVNVSTILSSLTLHSAKDSPISPAKEFAYNASKTALNAFTIHLANELKDTRGNKVSFSPHQLSFHLSRPKNTFIMVKALSLNLVKLYEGKVIKELDTQGLRLCLLYTSPSPRDS